MKESKERKKEECIQICSFCNKNLFETKNINLKMMKIFKDIFKGVELDEIIKKCNCDNNKYNIEAEGNEIIYMLISIAYY